MHHSTTEMFIDYTRAIMAYYKKKVAENSMTSNLSHPTSAKLKQECGRVCETRFKRNDLKTLNDFLGKGVDQAECLKTIQKFETDKFKPLVNYLLGRTAKTDEKNIELLAWLFDFEPRPFENWKKNQGGMKNISVEPVAETSDQSTDIQPIATMTTLFGTGNSSIAVTISPEIPVIHRFKRMLTKTNLLGVGVLLALGIGSYSFWNRNITEPLSTYSSPNGCMYWTGENYQQTPCNQVLGDTLIVALEPKKLTGFRKITRPDTISLKAIGHVWYIKINKGIEYYTGPGNHPVDPTRKLRPITDYMIKKYILEDSLKQKGG